MKAKLLILISIFLLSACLPSSVKTNNSFPTNLMMNAQDLPQHWNTDSFTKKDVENAESYNIQFSKPNVAAKTLLVQHQLSVYANVEAAKRAYPDWEKKWIPTDHWKTPDDFSFQPKDKDDLFRLACFEFKFNEQPILVCRYVQQHNNIITLVSADVDGNNLNIQQLANAIEILDLRLQQNK